MTLYPTSRCDEQRNCGHAETDGNRTSPDISAIIVSYNTRTCLADLLDSLRHDTGEHTLEIIVIDNSSTDHTSEMIEASYPEVKLLKNTGNVGMTKAANWGIREARGDFITLLDVDTVLAPTALGICRTYLASHPEVGIVAGRLMYPDGRVQISARNFPSAMNALFGRHSFLSKAFPNNRFTERYCRSIDHARTEPYEVDWVSAACMMFRRTTAQQTGGLDEDYFGYWVDADFCARVKKLGLKVFSIPSAVIVHAEQYQPGVKKSAKRIVTFHKGAYNFYRKHCVSSAFHPMRFIAGGGLLLRCGVMLAVNTFFKSPAKATSNTLAKGAL